MKDAIEDVKWKWVAGTIKPDASRVDLADDAVEPAAPASRLYRPAPRRTRPKRRRGEFGEPTAEGAEYRRRRCLEVAEALMETAAAAMRVGDADRAVDLQNRAASWRRRADEFQPADAGRVS